MWVSQNIEEIEGVDRDSKCDTSTRNVKTTSTVSKWIMKAGCNVDLEKAYRKIDLGNGIVTPLEACQDLHLECIKVQLQLQTDKKQTRGRSR